MFRDDQIRHEHDLLDEIVAEACRYLADVHGLRAGIDYQIEDAVAIAVQFIGAA